MRNSGRRENLNARLMRAEVRGDQHRTDHRPGRHREIFQIAVQGARQRRLKSFHANSPPAERHYCARHHLVVYDLLSGDAMLSTSRLLARYATSHACSKWVAPTISRGIKLAPRGMRMMRGVYRVAP